MTKHQRGLLIAVGALVAVLAIAGGVRALSGDDSPSGGAGSSSARTVTKFEVPVPDDARADDDGVYRVDSYGELEAFYDEHMPPGQDWGDFTYCADDSGPDGAGGEWRSWHANGTDATVIMVLGRAEGGQDPYVLVQVDEDDPIDC